MHIPLLMLITILSFSRYCDAICSGISTYRKHISYILLALAGASIFLALDTSGVKNSGGIAMSLLWLILWLPIFAKVWSVKIAARLMPFRKEIGIWMGVMALVHTTQYFLWSGGLEQIQTTEFWYMDGRMTFLAFGMWGMYISTILLATSSTYLIQHMGKYWKYLHSTVYILAIFSLAHVALLEFVRTLSRDPSASIWTVVPIIVVPFGLYAVGKYMEWTGRKIYSLGK